MGLDSSTVVVLRKTPELENNKYAKNFKILTICSIVFQHTGAQIMYARFHENQTNCRMTTGTGSNLRHTQTNRLNHLYSKVCWLKPVTELKIVRGRYCVSLTLTNLFYDCITYFNLAIYCFILIQYIISVNNNNNNNNTTTYKAP